MNTRRNHYSKKKLPRPLVSRRELLAIGAKPAGLWYGIDGDWERWLNDEDLGWTDGCWEYEVTVGNPDSVLSLRSPHDLRAFSEEFRTDGGRWCREIDWRAVAERFAGIEIVPYLWDCRLAPDVGWYYGWDAASGCIWDPTWASVTVKALTRHQAEANVDDGADAAFERAGDR